MANTGDEVGPTSDRVAANVRALRRDRGLDLADLSARLEKLGQPLGINALSKIELQKRRVDVEDLVALALALDVTPNRLLLPAAASGEVQLTSGFATSGVRAWQWATGDQPIPQDLWSEHPNRATFSRARNSRFAAENRPHTPDTEPLSAVDLEEHAEGLETIVRAIQDARDHGVPMDVIRGWFRLNEAMNSLADRVKRVRSRALEADHQEERAAD